MKNCAGDGRRRGFIKRLRNNGGDSKFLLRGLASERSVHRDSAWCKKRELAASLRWKSSRILLSEDVVHQDSLLRLRTLVYPVLELACHRSKKTKPNKPWSGANGIKIQFWGTVTRTRKTEAAFQAAR